MKTLQIRSLSLAAFAVVVLAGNAAAQDKSPALLNTLEVQQLVNRAEPGDHARLAAHFTALADRYVAEAKRHTSMSQSFGDTPSRNAGAGLSAAHCRRLAELNTQSATTVRELAAHHERLAAGTPSKEPTDRARFQQGAGDPKSTDRELSALAANARTPSDHRTLEEYFLTLAKRYSADATEHAAFAQSWRSSTRVAGAAITASHCDRLAATLREASIEANAAAAMHKELAGAGR